MIAPEPVSAAVASGAGHQPRTVAVAAQEQAAPDEAPRASASLHESLAEVLPPLPRPPDPPGTAYVAAVLSGALSPRPTTPEEVYQRIGGWNPPDSPLRLADKTA